MVLALTVSFIILGILTSHLLDLAFVTLGGHMDAPHDVVWKPMVRLVFFKTCVVLGTEHTAVLLSVLLRGLIKVQNFDVGFVLGGKVALLGLRWV